MLFIITIYISLIINYQIWKHCQCSLHDLCESWVLVWWTIPQLSCQCDFMELSAVQIPSLEAKVFMMGFRAAYMYNYQWLGATLACIWNGYEPEIWSERYWYKCCFTSCKLFKAIVLISHWHNVQSGEQGTTDQRLELSYWGNIWSIYTYTKSTVWTVPSVTPIAYFALCSCCLVYLEAKFDWWTKLIALI